MKQKKTVYVSANRPSEIIPLLGEALLFYDSVALDVSAANVFEVLAANIEAKTMEELLAENLIIPVYNTYGTIIAKQTTKTLNSIMLLDYEKNGIPPVDYGKLEEVFKASYPKNTIQQFSSKLTSSQVSSDILLENCRNDLNNLELTSAVFNFVRDRFDLPDFTIEISDGACYFTPKTKDKRLQKRVLDEATYGLHLISELNFRMALLSQFDEVVCESELEDFFVKKLRQAYRKDIYRNQSDNFLELCEIHDFPDIKENISAGLMNISDILKLRKGDGQILRHWLDNTTRTCLKEQTNFSKSVAKLIINNSNSGLSLPTRTVIFGFLQVLSIIKPVESVLLSAANEFIVPKVIEKWQPKYFFDKARKLQIKKTMKVN
ncbi:hypothetical protein [Paenibacillus radicis (ex Xue et al. 2023)]|uniref:Uncharacterized protein n=1 Tax=Paenibacillus radicis (ex Xue et al. 2023) TaxID=2972489 RepID=A0ABT1YMF8_9BACL|nr:hypothetical protein [Paenibacillus radicis (ex Xue et al. 2023)]MCR8633920.1 hypothetical protein [Paenibacillus radicis (ex Xue et al. 2023)]